MVIVILVVGALSGITGMIVTAVMTEFGWFGVLAAYPLAGMAGALAACSLRYAHCALQGRPFFGDIGTGTGLPSLR